MVAFKDLEDHAIEMANIYKDHSKQIEIGAPDGTVFTDSLVTDEGLDKLDKRFKLVPIEKRQAVFSIFQDKLRDLGLGYDMEQFRGTRH